MKNSKTTVRYYYEMLQEHTQGKYVKESLVILVVSGLLFGGYSAFNWYKKRQNVQAFAGLVEVSKAYEKSVTTVRSQQESSTIEQIENPWEDTQLLLEAISSANTGSSLSPLFVFYQAELALQQEDDYEKACKLMEQGVRRLPKTSIYYDMFNLKLIKMLLDSPQEAVVKNALQDLTVIAHNSNNYYYQDALHTLAMYEASKGNMPAAIEAWKTLAASQEDKALIASPYATQAQDKLKSLNITLETSN